MIIGSFLARTAKYKLTKIIYKHFGTLDLHSHIRLKPVFTYLSKRLKLDQNLSILEIGCGGGVIPFQLLEEGYKFNYLGIDKEAESINSANKILEKYTEQSVSFISENVENLQNEIRLDYYEIILLVDIIEHLDNANELLQKIFKRIKPGCKIIISVPTPLYPKVFGRRFHKQVGHVVDGYTLNNLDELFDNFNYSREYSGYNTGLIANLFCAAYYRLLFENKIIYYLKSLLLYFGKNLDLINNKSVSCSIFAIYNSNKCEGK